VTGRKPLTPCPWYERTEPKIPSLREEAVDEQREPKVPSLREEAVDQQREPKVPSVTSLLQLT
jgi:hypothetical protein